MASPQQVQRKHPSTGPSPGAVGGRGQTREQRSSGHVTKRQEAMRRVLFFVCSLECASGSGPNATQTRRLKAAGPASLQRDAQPPGGKTITKNEWVWISLAWPKFQSGLHSARNARPPAHANFNASYFPRAPTRPPRFQPLACMSVCVSVCVSACLPLHRRDGRGPLHPVTCSPAALYGAFGPVLAQWRSGE